MIKRYIKDVSQIRLTEVIDINAIELKGVVKKFKKYTAVDNISFNIPKNTIFGLLGSNGAGKTTIINMITGLLKQNEGTITVLGMNSTKQINEIRKNIALVPQTISLYESLSIYENLEFFGSLYISKNKELKEKIVEILKIFELTSKKDVKICNLSGGYQRRCSMGCALISNPKILFLDEPLTGIDIKTTDVIMKFLKSIKGITIIFTTHSIKDAEVICNRVLFMDEGKKILEGTPKNLQKQYAKKFGEQIKIEFKKKVSEKKVETYLKKSGLDVTKITSKGNMISFYTKDLGKTVIDMMEHIGELHVNVSNVEIKKPSLEDIFNHIIKSK